MTSFMKLFGSHKYKEVLSVQTAPLPHESCKRRQRRSRGWRKSERKTPAYPDETLSLTLLSFPVTQGSVSVLIESSKRTTYCFPLNMRIFFSFCCCTHSIGDFKHVVVLIWIDTMTGREQVIKVFKCLAFGPLQVARARTFFNSIQQENSTSVPCIICKCTFKISNTDVMKRE